MGEVWGTPWTSRQFITELTQRDRQSFICTLTSMNDSETPINLDFLSLYSRPDHKNIIQYVWELVASSGIFSDCNQGTQPSLSSNVSGNYSDLKGGVVDDCIK